MASEELEALKREIDEAVAISGRSEEMTHKPMFGGVCSYADGRVFASLSNVGIGLKLSAKDQEEALKIEGAKRLQYEESMPPSKSYIVLPATLRSSPEQFASWVDLSVKYVLTLPAPKKKITK